MKEGWMIWSKKTITVFASLVFIITGAAVTGGKAKAASDLDLAYRWAPVHIQDTDSSDYDADYLSAIDFDDEWDTSNNWENQPTDVNRLKGTTYYSIVETPTHWFIMYAFYHPRDWTDFPFLGLDEHENDLEGELSIVRKDGTEYGKLEAMVTVFHSDFYSFKPNGSPYTNGQETIDGTVHFLNYDGVERPVTFQEAKGHGLKAWDGTNYDNTDVIYYYPSKDTAEVPDGGNDRDVKYKLVDVFAQDGMWSHRYDPQTFSSWGSFNGNNGNGGANAPWGWDDKDDGGQLTRGVLATDPARLVSIYFGNLGSFSTDYTRNPYDLGTVYRFEASNFAGSFIRHASSRVRIDSDITPSADSEWRMISGLADSSGVSFESINYPGQFLRHRDGEVWKDQYAGDELFREDATFYIRNGLADSSLISFESYNYPGRYLRHRGSLLYNEEIMTDQDKSDATFRQH